MEDWLHGIVGDDPRFLLGRRTEANPDYNYNDNPELTEAIKSGHRGVYWDILRRVSKEFLLYYRANLDVAKVEYAANPLLDFAVNGFHIFDQY